LLEALSTPGWRAPIQEEMTTLDHNQTSDLATLPSRKQVGG